MISFNNIGNLGRLANQMFQYASLKGIARNRGYEFSIPPEQVFGQNDPLVKDSPLNIYNVFENISNNNIQISKNPILQERMHEFDEELFRSCPDNVDFFGYYQSPKYFEHVKDEIKNKNFYGRSRFIANKPPTVSDGQLLFLQIIFIVKWLIFYKLKPLCCPNKTRLRHKRP